MLWLLLFGVRVMGELDGERSTDGRTDCQSIILALACLRRRRRTQKKSPNITSRITPPTPPTAPAIIAVLVPFALCTKSEQENVRVMAHWTHFECCATAAEETVVDALDDRAVFAVVGTTAEEDWLAFAGSRAVPNVVVCEDNLLVKCSE